MAKQNTVRVRVKPGHTIRTGVDQNKLPTFARGGDFIDADRQDLELESFRAAVETEEEIKAAEERKQSPSMDETRHKETAEQFEQFRQAARSHNEAYARARTEDEKHMARELLAQHPDEAAAWSEGKKMAPELKQKQASR